MKKYKSVVLVVFLAMVAVLVSFPVFSETPNLVNYQGYLKQSGSPVTGNRYFEFRIYNVETGGTQKWTSGSTVTAVSNGLFRHVLGSTTDGITGVDWQGDTNYLEILVGETSPDTTLSPREKLVAVPYALNADLLDGLNYDAFVSITGDNMSGGLDIDESDSTKAYSLKARTGATYGLYVSTFGSVGIGISASSHTLHVEGDIYATGDICTEGGIDPPYVLYDSQTRQAIIDRVASSIPEEKRDGAVLFFNGEGMRLEIYLPQKGEFRDLSGSLLATYPLFK